MDVTPWPSFVQMMAEARAPKGLRHGALKEFIGVTTEEGGRRPRGLGKGGRGDPGIVAGGTEDLALLARNMRKA